MELAQIWTVFGLMAMKRQPFASEVQRPGHAVRVVQEFERVQPFSWELDNPLSGLLDCVLPWAGVTHPGLRARLGHRDDRALLRSLLDSIFEPREHQPVLQVVPPGGGPLCGWRSGARCWAAWTRTTLRR